MTANAVNVAVVGLGFGTQFIPIYKRHPSTNMYAICRRSRPALDAVGDAFGVERRYLRYEDVLADPAVDFVHINTPLTEHGWMSIAALEAGKHVMCTVPMAISVEECQRIVELVRKTGLTYMMAETVLYAREYLFAKELHERGELGEDPVPAGQSPPGHGRLARWLARASADVLRHPLHQPLHLHRGR